jgi:hypothetical protein
MLDMPLKINWDHMDNKLLSRFFQRFPERKAGLYECGALTLCWLLPWPLANGCCHPLLVVAMAPCEWLLSSLAGCCHGPLRMVVAMAPC